LAVGFVLIVLAALGVAVLWRRDYARFKQPPSPPPPVAAAAAAATTTTNNNTPSQYSSSPSPFKKPISATNAPPISLSELALPSPPPLAAMSTQENQQLHAGSANLVHLETKLQHAQAEHVRLMELEQRLRAQVETLSGDVV
jgi:hypothetical protein